MSICRHSLISFLLVVSMLSCKQNKHVYIENRGEIFHTSYLIKYEYSHSLQSEIETMFAEYDDSLNPFKENSIITKVNNNEPTELDSYFINVFNKARSVSEVSDGLFDITIAPLINAWGFGFKNMDDLSQASIDSLKSIVGYDKIELQNGVIVKKDSRVQLNASAIAKGYATDMVAALLDSYNIQNYMVEIGGEIRAKGSNAKKELWQIGISRPTEENIFDNELQVVIGLNNKSIATSGDYRKFYMKDGKKYAHTIDPRTGYPANNGILSASVIADDCMTADAYATVFMLADTAHTQTIATQQKLSYMLILADNDDSYKIVKSSDFDKYIVR